MLSRTAEYALRAIVWLSDHPETSVTGQALAAATQVPPDYLAKVMQSLVRAGLVEAQRGKNGGFSLVSTPDRRHYSGCHQCRRAGSPDPDLPPRPSRTRVALPASSQPGQHRRPARTCVRRYTAADLLRSAGVKPLCPVAEAPHA
jgi:hypothetical protein